MIYVSHVPRSADDDRDYLFEPVLTDFPEVFDLRDKQVADQGSVGSCTANAVTSACENLLPRDKYRELSRLFLYYATRELEGRIGQEGASTRNALKLAAKLGIPDEVVWPYDLARVDIKPTPDIYALAGNHKLMRYERIYINPSNKSAMIPAIKSALLEGCPVVFASAISDKWITNPSQYYGVGEPGTSLAGNHAMLFVGWNPMGFVIENSWGPQWGDQGYETWRWRCMDDVFEAWAVRGFDGYAVTKPEPPPPAPPTPTPPPEPTPPQPVQHRDENNTMAYTAGVILALAMLIVFLTH